MPSETLLVDGEFADDGLVVNSELDHDEDPDVSAVTIDATSNNVDTEWGGGFPTPSDVPTVGVGLQEFRVGVEEFDSEQTGVPMARIELHENGALIRAGPDLSVNGYVVMSFPWDAAEIAAADGSLVQCKLVGTRSGGGASAKNSLRIGHMEWNATIGLLQAGISGAMRLLLLD